ncbi:MAG: hypothetical protein BHV88_20965 [Clostridiales bacterium 41_12_two_minus]|nr:MAG: hypothetical protein BHV88_20965 [Clostridiales bacterium 41_12_two_minus]
MSQSKACLQGVNESFSPPSVKTTDQPGGASHFTTPLDPVPFWNLHLVAENQATKDHSAVLRADFQAAAYPPGYPQFWGDLEHLNSVTGYFSLRHSIENKLPFAFSMQPSMI